MVRPKEEQEDVSASCILHPCLAAAASHPSFPPAPSYCCCCCFAAPQPAHTRIVSLQAVPSPSHPFPSHRHPSISAGKAHLAVCSRCNCRAPPAPPAFPHPLRVGGDAFRFPSPTVAQTETLAVARRTRATFRATSQRLQQRAQLVQETNPRSFPQSHHIYYAVAPGPRP